MRCPFCGHEDTQVKDSRPTDDNGAIRRRRVCSACSGRFTTFERVQLRDLTVIKGDGRREPFDADKLQRSLEIALRKRPVPQESLERVVTSIIRQLESSGDGDISSSQIGELAMQALAGLDQVAYVRYASVYRNFREVSDFNQFLGDINNHGDGEGARVRGGDVLGGDVQSAGVQGADVTTLSELRAIKAAGGQS